MSLNYSPSPWHVQEVKTGAEPAVVDARDQFVVPFVCLPKGNAHLIAGAPVMLDTLMQIARLAHEGQTSTEALGDIAKTSLAKATGVQQ